MSDPSRAPDVERPEVSRGTRTAVHAALTLFALIVTGVVSVAADRHLATTRLGAVADEHGDHDAHGEEHAAHDAEPAHEGAEHRPHADVAVVRLTPEQRESAKLELLVAAPGRVDETLSLPGEIALDADGVAHVSPRTPGAVREVKANLGDHVRKGDVLATLESREVASMQQEALAARARLDLARSSYERVAKLYESQIASEKEYLASKQALAEARIDETSATQKLAAGAGPRSAGNGLTLVAPIEGTVIEKHLTLGEVLTAETRAFTIADLSTLWVWTSAHAREAATIRRGQRAYVRADGIEAPLEGSVDYVEATLDERTRTARFRVTVKAPPEAWRPGMFVRTDVVVSQVDARVVVLEDAIQRIGEHEVVFVEEDGRFEARPVELGKPGRDVTGRRAREVVAGVPAGASYVARNAFTLKAELGKGSASHEH